MAIPDHRKIGRELKVYTTDPLCGAGLPLWLPAGAAIRGEVERFIVDLERSYGYLHVYTPQLAKRELFERSGHWVHFQDEMYPPMDIGSDQVLLRPMNCPHHILVFSAERRSARHLPLRLAELGTMFRMERSGVVGGLSRVRQMTLNDGHVFCAPEHIASEIAATVELVQEAYRTLGIPPPTLRLSKRGTGPKYSQDACAWERSEATIREVLADLGLDYHEANGEAAFYGPKIDFQITDPRGRQETLSTIQLDFHLPRRFDLTYRRGAALECPVIIHRSVVSTMERLVAHLLEAHDGALPVWLAPTQVTVLPVHQDAMGHSLEMVDLLRRSGIRCELDDREATLAARVRQCRKTRVPYLAVVGAREAATGEVSVRLRGATQHQSLAVSEFVELVRQAVASRTLEVRLGPSWR